MTLDVWQLPKARVPAAMWRMARDRSRLRRVPGVRFAKLLGTGAGAEFGARSADLTRWAALICWDRPPSREGLAAWDRLTTRSCRLVLRPVASRGSWSGRTPFEAVDRARAAGPAVAITRARLRPSRAVRFWRAIPSVGATLPGTPGLLAAFGMGEAPVGWQGTVSVWATPDDLVAFAYRRAEHVSAIARTPVERWYAEELFARFALTDVTGDTGVIGWSR